MGTNRPVLVVHIQLRRHGRQIEVGFPVRFQGSHIAPVRLRIRVGLHAGQWEGMCIGHASFGDFRDDVFTEVVAGAFVFVVFFEQLIKIICIKDIDPHAGEGFGVIARHGWRVRRFFNEVDNLVVRIHVHHAKRRRLGNGHRQTRHGAARPFFDVVDQHVRVILLVDVVTREDHDVFRAVAANNVEVLGHRIRRAAVPVFPVYALLRREQIDKLVHLFAEE